MCGIVGIAGNRIAKDVELLRQMRDTMTHRGPDDAGDWWSEDGSVGLAMRRLSIIDLSSSGHQPMSDHDRNLTIVFNGEIYNYKELKKELESRGRSFTTSSDTEVILESYREWKTDCVKHLNGMFAFAIYDIRKKALFLARDRAGEKPLFYLHEQNKFRFGSELKSILADKSVSRNLDFRSLNFYLSFGYVPGELCILQNFKKLPPAHAMVYDIENDTLKIWRYWELAEPTRTGKLNEDDLLEELERLLEGSVKQQLVADVPVGIMLSGGIDSSLVTAMASRASSEKVKTFTVTFPGFGTFNEAPYAKTVANHFGTDHTELEAGSVEPQIMIELARQYDEPIGDSSMIPMFMVSKLIRRHATVALGGDGGDELFGGYLHYSMILRTLRRQRFLPSSLKAILKLPIEALLPPGFPYKDKALFCLSADPHHLVRSGSYFDSRTTKRVLSDHRDLSISDSERFSFNTFGMYDRKYSPLRQAMSVDFLNYLPSDVLVKVDRASMLASLEVRAPFLDYRIVEFAFGSVPDHLKATENERKILLKRLARKVLPRDLDLNRKQGFSIPLGNWFKKGWGKFMTEVLHDDAQTIFDKKAIDRLAALQYRGIFNYQRLYAATMFELWRREYGISIK
ncbi:MAG: asparagine synthase (glutamine-hydrolyzing) [Bacteroidetes bacterium]|nr:asparagine synthase (glutamine-hydrolyzing) [Bacteroidota bacterium]MCL5737064.1 asparagine synthase (glutamine-hydrolyzing) [Bacteroidota bacterium]